VTFTRVCEKSAAHAATNAPWQLRILRPVLWLTSCQPLQLPEANMKRTLLPLLLLATLSTGAMAQNVTVNVPDGYKIELVPVNTPEPQTAYVTPQVVAPAPVVRVAPRARHLASVGEGMIIEHQIDDHHH